MALVKVPQAAFFPGMEECDYQSISASHSLIGLSFFTSSLSSATRLIIYLVTPHALALFCPQILMPGSNIPCSLRRSGQLHVSQGAPSA